MKAFCAALIGISSLLSQVSHAEKKTTGLKLSCNSKNGESLIIVHSAPPLEGTRSPYFIASAISVDADGAVQSSDGLGTMKQGQSIGFGWNYQNFSGSTTNFFNYLSVGEDLAPCGRSPICDRKQFYTATLESFNNAPKIEFNCSVIK